jgi:hypothetical protein
MALVESRPKISTRKHEIRKTGKNGEKEKKQPLPPSASSISRPHVFLSKNLQMGIIRA